MERISKRLARISLRDLLAVGLPALLVLAGGFWFAAQFIKPAPPDELVITTGSDGGAFQHYAARYKAILERFGIRLIEKPSAGSIENLDRLADAPQAVDVGFVQGGTGAGGGDAGLVSLGSLYYEPLWVFYRGQPGLNRIDQLAGRRIAIGAPGSGTARLARELLDAHGLTAKVSLLPLSGLQAAAALDRGEVDALFVVGAPLTGPVWLLLHTPGLALLDFSQAESYARRFPYLSEVRLPRGVISFERDIPPRDVRLVAPVATLVAREGTHPALLDLLLQAMREVHSPAGIFEKAGEFPAAGRGDFPMSPRAERFYASGPPFLQRYLPFWVANFIDRVFVMAVPLIALLIPLIKIMPPLYSWRVRSRIYRWYGELKYIEYEFEANPLGRSREQWEADLERIERAVNRTHIPLAFADQLYNLRTHIAVVRQSVARRLDEAPPRGA
jgi:TRAP-type uncharacterized transport system substrate-binding protein